MLHFRYSGILGRHPPGCLGGLVACIYGPFGGILDHDCGVCSVVRLSSARREDVPMRRSPLRPAFSWRVWPLSANERRPQSFRKELARKKSRQSFLESVCYVPSEKALASPPHGFATAGDFAMLESCPSRPPANREGIRLRRCSVGSNAQVPANWPFLQILAQSQATHLQVPTQAPE